MTHEISTNSKKLILVVAPDDAYDFKIGNYNSGISPEFCGLHYYTKEKGITEQLLPHYQYKLLGIVTRENIDDFDVSNFCESYFGDMITKGCWKNYESGIMECQTKEESFLSLLKSNNIDLTKKWVCIEIKN